MKRMSLVASLTLAPLAFAAAGGGATALAAQEWMARGPVSRQVPRQVSQPVFQDPASHLVVISGLSGEPRFAAAFAEWGAALTDAALSRHALPAGNVVWLAEAEDVHARVSARSTRDNVARELRALAARAGADDRVMIVLIGHGSMQGGENRLNLPGPDITGAALAEVLSAFRTQRVAVVNTASASGGFIQDLAAPGRIVVTATRTGFEQNETVFGRHFTAALSGDAADTDQDGRLSLLEAFEYARLETEREYQRANKLMTEHAVLDALGDGRGVAKADSQDPHARAARSFILGGAAGGAAAGAAASPELRALYVEKDRIEAALDALRDRRATMQPAAYDAALEELLVELSLNAQAIRRAGGGS